MDEKEIVLGSVFLRKYYSVFDWDAQVIGCTNALFQLSKKGYLLIRCSCKAGVKSRQGDVSAEALKFTW